MPAGQALCHALYEAADTGEIARRNVVESCVGEKVLAQPLRCRIRVERNLAFDEIAYFFHEAGPGCLECSRSCLVVPIAAVERPDLLIELT